MHKPAEKLQEGFYRIPQLQPSLFTAVEGDRLLEDGMRATAERLERSQRFSILMGALARKPGIKQRVLKVLEHMEGSEEAFKATLDTIAYSRRRDVDSGRYNGLSDTLDTLEKCIAKRLLPVSHMKDLLHVGVVFEESVYNASITPSEMASIIQEERNWINGGEKTLDGRADIFFPSDDSMIAFLQNNGVPAVQTKSGVVPIENAPPETLMAVYASKMRSEKAAERRKERFLTTNDW